jgi:hypothetical protein
MPVTEGRGALCVRDASYARDGETRLGSEGVAARPEGDAQPIVAIADTGDDGHLPALPERIAREPIGGVPEPEAAAEGGKPVASADDALYDISGTPAECPGEERQGKVFHPPTHGLCRLCRGERVGPGVRGNGDSRPMRAGAGARLKYRNEMTARHAIAEVCGGDHAARLSLRADFSGKSAVEMRLPWATAISSSLPRRHSGCVHRSSRNRSLYRATRCRPRQRSYRREAR